MIAQITEGIKVSVETTFQSEYSHPEHEHFMYAYRVRIENLGDHSIQLLRRHWYIYDSCRKIREVQGDGVVGLQPVLQPGEHHEYVSGCHLTTDIGAMWGTYTMRRELDDSDFEVTIPRFMLMAPYRLS